MEGTPYASCVESIMYDMICSILDLSYTINTVSQLMANIMANMGQVHCQALKWVLRYLKGSLKYTRITWDEDALVGYVDEGYVRNVDTRKSLSVLCLLCLARLLLGKEIKIQRGFIYNSIGVYYHF